MIVARTKKTKTEIDIRGYSLSNSSNRTSAMLKLDIYPNPWKKRKIEYEVVRFSNPNSSTKIMGDREINGPTDMPEIMMKVKN